MLDTAWHQLRHGLALVAERPIRAADVEALARHAAATRAEFGRLDRDQVLQAMGRAPDEGVRATINARRWRAAVRAAYEHTPYYRAQFDRLGLTPAELTFERRAALPPTSKAALRGLPEAFVSDTATPVLQAWTTGSTGNPTSCWFSAYELDLAAAYGAMFRTLVSGFGPADTVQLSLSSRAVLAVHSTMRSLQIVGAGCVLTGVVDPALTMARLTAPVHLPGKKPRVSSLTIPPSHLAEIVQLGERQGYDPRRFGLAEIHTGGEILTDALRLRAERLFGAPVHDSYGMTETFPVFGQECSQRHLHFAGDHGLVEILDPVTWQPTSPGGVGMLVVTPFPPYRETVLLLRYATGDLVRTLTGPPGCELAGQPATTNLLGKADFSPEAGGLRLYQRDVLDLLEGEPAIPLPARYHVELVDDGFDLHVLAPEDDHSVVARLEARAEAAELPIRKIVLTRDECQVRQRFHRALLRETSVVRSAGGASWTLS
jgi:phenylacetate-coenzyme A ligase PaaK-like adenylate-forming protein